MRKRQIIPLVAVALTLSLSGAAPASAHPQAATRHARADGVSGVTRI